jgi:methylisocitrate lyase
LQAAIDRAYACVEQGPTKSFEAITELAMYGALPPRSRYRPREHHRIRRDATLQIDNCAADVAVALYPLTAFRAMNRPAEHVYQTVARAEKRHRRDQTRRALRHLGYHAFETKLDALFARGKP